MGLRSLLAIFTVQALLFTGLNAKSIRIRRDSTITVDNNPSKRDVVIYSASSPSESKSYHPPLLAAPPAATVARAIGNNGYQPPLLQAQSSNDYKPLISSSQTQSVRYQPPGNNMLLQGIPLAFAQSQTSSQSYSAPLLASAQTGNSNTVPLQQGSRQGFAYNPDHGSVNNFNQQPPIHAESQPAAAAVPSDGKNAEYVVYYYYYYDNDTAANGSSNFDDIPSLESYDSNKSAKEPEKSASARTLAADVNSLNTNSQDHRRIPEISSSSQPRSASSGSANQPPFIRSDKPSVTPDELAVQPLKPVSNVFRYGANEVPRFPILPNFVVSDPPVTTRQSFVVTSDAVSDENPTTPDAGNLPGNFPSSHVVHVNENESDDLNVVLDQPADSKSEDNKVAIEEQTTTTTTELPTTTEIATTTTTEKSRRRPGTGNRRRFNPNPNFSSNRRQGQQRSTSTSSSTTTTTPASGISSTRGSFRGSNRVRSRPTIASTRPRPSLSRNAPSVADDEEPKPTVVSSVSTSTTARPRFGVSSSAPRRFSSTRTRSQVPNAPIRSTTSTTTTSRPRSAAAPRPRPNLISSRARPPRPGLFRSRTPTEPEEQETTTTVPEMVTEEESVLSSPNASAEDNETNEETAEDEETADTEPEEPSTTEKSRFSALFRPRNRSTLNRPKPPIARRSR